MLLTKIKKINERKNSQKKPFDSNCSLYEILAQLGHVFPIKEKGMKRRGGKKICVNHDKGRKDAIVRGGQFLRGTRIRFQNAKECPLELFEQSNIYIYISFQPILTTYEKPAGQMSFEILCRRFQKTLCTRRVPDTLILRYLFLIKATFVL